MSFIGRDLEKSGWRQGSIVKQSNIDNLLESTSIPNEDGMVLMVASQSCDIANNDLSAEPFVECSIARWIAVSNGHYTYGKNPRTLHTNISCLAYENEVISSQHLELVAFEKVNIPKGSLDGLQPDNQRILEVDQLRCYTAWLSARYSRPALPTTFNNLINRYDPKGKLRKEAKRANSSISGIYVQIIPNREIADDENYSVNLIGLLPAGYNGSVKQPEATITAYAEVLKKAGMDVRHAVKKESEVSVAFLKDYCRFFLDDLSYKDNAPLPPEVSQ